MVAKILKLAVVPVLLAALPVLGAAPAAVAGPRCPVWNGVQPPGSDGESLAGVTVLRSCVAWAVGASPIQQITGSSWVPQASQPPGAPRGLVAVAAVSATSAWAVGSGNGRGHQHAVIEHWDGTSWSPQQATQPAAAPHPDVLTGVAATSAADAWAVGYYGTGSGHRTLIEHWNGTNWRQVPSPSPGGKGSSGQLTGVAVTSPTKAWAVGFYQTPKSGQRILILRWNGTSWRQVPGPDPSQRAVLTSVAATRAAQAWAVGYAITGKTGGEGVPITRTVLLQWDGANWTQIPSPNLVPFGDNRLLGVAATASYDIWAVGYDRRPGDNVNGLLLHWDGGEWQAPMVPLSNIADDAEILYGVATAGVDNVWVVGVVADRANLPLILHYDGQSWQS